MTTDGVGDKIPVYPCWQYDPDADEFVKWAHIDMSKPQGQVKQNVPPQCVSLKDSRRTIIICVFFLDTQDQLLFVA